MNNLVSSHTVEPGSADSSVDILPAVFPSTVRAIVFDVDGTLYNQHSLRRAMAWELALAFCSSPKEQIKIVRFLKAYRNVQEHLRESSAVQRNLMARQLELACECSNTPQAKALEYLERWFEREPLKHLKRLANADVSRFIQQAKSNGLALGVYSDYPSAEKLKVLGLGGLFEVISCSSDADIGKFKPDPTGLHQTLKRLAVRAEDAVYVGDRMDVDLPCARAAGLHAIILDSSAKCEDGVTKIRNFGELLNLFNKRQLFPAAG
jgi:HAD superfamily hydrolase (TIGR01549 family)